MKCEVKIKIKKKIEKKLMNFRQNGYEVVVRDLPLGMDPNYLGNYFAQQGGVLNVRIEGTIAFVTFDSKESLDRAMATLNYSRFNNVPIRMIKYDDETRRISAEGIGIVIVRGLPHNIDISEIHNFFSRIGEVITVQIPQTEWGDLGFAFVQYRDNKTASRAASELSGFRVQGNIISVDVIKTNGTILPTKKAADIQIQSPKKTPITAYVGTSVSYGPGANIQISVPNKSIPQLQKKSHDIPNV